MILNFYEQEKSGFSVMNSDELFFICGGTEQDSSNKNGKDYDTTWELGVEGEVKVDSAGKVSPQVTVSYTVHK